MKVEKVREKVIQEFGVLTTIEKKADTLPGKPEWELRIGYLLIASRSTPYGAYMAAKTLILQDGLFYSDVVKDYLDKF